MNGDEMKVRKISTEKAPKAIGPYSQAISSGNLLFLSGQIPIDPNTGKLVEGTIQDQTHRTMKNLKAVLEAAGTDFSHVVKTNIYLKDLANFKLVNEVYGSYFTDNMAPARATVQVSGLPLGAEIEIDMIAVLVE
jgi:2-iminobutanoate/2-iminopropanoate deaminase